MRELKRYFSYMGKYIYPYWTILVITLIVEATLQILYSYTNKQILNAVEYYDVQMFKTALIVCVIIVILKCIFPYLRYFAIKLVRTIVFELKIKLFHKLMKLDMEYYEKNHSGEALKTLNWDANSLKDSYFSHVYWVLGKVTGGCSAIIAMLIYSPTLAVVSFIISSITVVVSVKVNQELKHKSKNIQKSITDLTKRLSDILFGFSILKMYAGSFIVIANYKEENDKVTKQENSRVRQAASLEMVTFLLGILGSFGTIVVGIFLVAEGKMDYGTVMAVVTLQMSVSDMVQRFGGALATFSGSLVKAGRVFDFLELEGEEESSAERIKVNEDALPIKINNLRFAYDGKSYVFNGFDMSVKRDERIMIMGESGGGKSTLLKMLLGFYKQSSGEIQIYGKRIEEYPLVQLRELITFIPQDSYLFEGTIRENISYGCLGKCEEDIINAAKSAGAHEFIVEMPEGYDTVLNAGGTDLSGGQRQRIAIARAFLKNSPIILMDEPVSALDVECEKRIHTAIKHLMHNRVVLMVTHRSTGVDEFDRVIKL